MLPVLLREENYEAKNGARSQYTGSHENIELLLRTVISANQFSVYGAVADLCDEFSEDFRASGKPEAPDNLDNLETMRFPLALLLQKLRPMQSNGET